MNVKKYLTTILLFFLCSGLSKADEDFQFHPHLDCPYGECFEALVSEADQLKEEAFSNGCIPRELDLNTIEIDTYLDNNIISETCLRIIARLDYNQEKIELTLAYLDGILAEDAECSELAGADIDLGDLSGLSDVNARLACTDQIKEAQRRECANDFKCALSSILSTLTGPIGSLVGLDTVGGESCDSTQDSCLIQLATGFVKGAELFFEGTWELLKMAGRGIRNGLSNMWDWMRGAEDHSSTAQLAAAQASEDEGVFRQLIDDFPGTMARAWEGLTEALGIWMKENVFCQRWEGLPYYSECLEPAIGFDCLSCKQKINGLCGISGIFIAEIVPAFITGGLITSIRYGASGAAAIARSISVSSASMSRIKNSPLASYASTSYNETARAVSRTTLLARSREAVRAAKSALESVLVRPSSLFAKSLATKMKNSTSVTLLRTAGQNFFSFSGKALKVAFRAVIYPIENPLTRRAYTLGSNSLESVFTLGRPTQIQGGVRLSLSSARLSTLEEIDQARIRFSSSRQSATPQEQAQLAEDYLQLVQRSRQEVAPEVLDRGIRNIIDDLYPELSPSFTGVEITTAQRARAFDELTTTIENIPSPALRQRLARELQAEMPNLTSGPSRTTVQLSEVLENSRLGDQQRIDKAFDSLDIDLSALSPAQREQLSQGLIEAHNVGSARGASVFEYTIGELRQKRQILLSSGFTSDQADYLLRSGLAGRPPTRQVVERAQTRLSDHHLTLTARSYDDVQSEILRLHGQQSAPRTVRNRVSNFFGFRQTRPNLEDPLDALYFIDHRHSIAELSEFGLTGTRDLASLNYINRYERTAFENFRDTRRMLAEQTPELSLDTLKDIHRSMMKGGVENVPNNQLGVIREGEWYGNVPSTSPLSDDVLDVITSNPYLTFEHLGSVASGHYGRIRYPLPRTLQPTAIRRLESVDPGLADEVRDIQRINRELAERQAELERIATTGNDPELLARASESITQLQAEHAAYAANMNRYNQRVAEALTQERFNWFRQRRAQIGELDSAEKLDDFADLVAEFQRDLVSIHPLSNGNGRSTRMLALDYALRREGLPPATILDTNLDLYSSLDQWQSAVREGILASSRRQQDILERVRHGLPLENSLDFVTPHRPPAVALELRRQGSTVARQTDGVEHIDPRVYRELVKRELSTNPNLVQEIQANPTEAWRRIDERVSETFRQNNLHFDHRKFGLERVELGLVDDDFRHLFGRSTYDNPELFRFKMDNWYDDSITWRGLASKTAEKSEREILDMFRYVNRHMASNNVVRRAGSNATPEELRRLSLEDLDQYNSDLFDDGLVRMARDHSETGPLYGQSYGYSTSKNREVGKAFAMGAMVIAEYGQHQQFQHLLRSRVLVGARKAHKDVDLTRLKQVRDDFSYRYGRQQEVMGVGAADPDAISIIQTIDANGDVILSYLRHPENPSQIMIIRGDTRPGQTPDPDTIVRTVDLNN